MQQMTQDEVLDQAARLAKNYGESLTLTAFRRKAGVSQWIIFDLFETGKVGERPSD